jgi:hypothetical protein
MYRADKVTRSPSPADRLIPHKKCMLLLAGADDVVNLVDEF